LTFDDVKITLHGTIIIISPIIFQILFFGIYELVSNQGV